MNILCTFHTAVCMAMLQGHANLLYTMYIYSNVWKQMTDSNIWNYLTESKENELSSF